VRDDTTDPRDARDPNHIWLRQSITFSVNGQTRTLELALPLRPGATPEEVDALLDEADAGMRRLSQRLDAHLAEVTGAASVAPVAPTTSPAPAAATTSPASRNAAPPSAAQPMPQAHAAPQPTSAEHPTPRAAAAAQPAAAPSPTSSPAPASAGPDLTRPEFLAAVGALGLDARTVMERLNVRSLNGLNLREALELLRRQAVREGGATADPQPAPPAASAASMPAPIGRARFDEEDEADEADDSLDFELSYPDPDDLPSDEDFGDVGDEAFAPRETLPATPPAPPAAAPATSRAATGPLNDDVPDLDDLLAASTAPTPTPVADSAPERARAVIATLRTAHPGGQPTAQQRMAYRNIVVDQLGEAKANSVARAVWSLTPDKLGPEQYDALIRWGKQDTFAEEVEEALTLLRAEWAAQQAAQQAAGQAAQPAKPATPAARQPAQSAPQSAAQPPAQTPPARPAPRGRPAAGSRANADAPRDGAGSQGGA
jgi:ribosomal protein L12E/L44/L45/RPP1/RPP2